MNVSSWIFGNGSQDESSSNNSPQNEPAPPQPQPALDPEEVRRRRLNHAQLTATTTPKPSVEVSNTVKDNITSPPKRANIKLEPNNTTPQNSKKTRPPSSPNTRIELNDPPSAATSGAAKADRYSRTLNLVFEFIFQITVRQESARGNIKFVDTEGDSDFLNVDNLEYLLPMRLMEVVQEGVAGAQQGAACYLIRAHKRLLEKEGQTLQEDPLHDDLQR